MAQKSKRNKKIVELLGEHPSAPIKEAVEQLKKCPELKFDQSVDIAIKLGVDPKKSDQQVRGTVFLPHGTGKNVVVLVLTQGDKVKAALDAGADFAGGEEYIEKIKGGWTGFSALVATPDMMREVGKLGKVLGPRGLMPSPKAGTVTPDVAKAVQEIKKGKVEFKLDKSGVINNMVGKLSFAAEKLEENINAFLQAVNKAKPASAKGIFIKSAALSSTMGPGIRLELQVAAI